MRILVRKFSTKNSAYLALGGAIFGIVGSGVSAYAAPAKVSAAVSNASGGATFTAAKTATKGLAWTEWELTSPTYPGLTKAPVLRFTEERVSASVGLNGMSGQYSATDGALKIGPLMSTRMGGSQPLMDAEQRYGNALQAVRGYSLSRDGKTLTLYGTQTLTYRLAGRTRSGFVATETRVLSVGPALGPQLDGDRTPRFLQLEDLSTGVSWGKFTEERILGFQFVPGYRSLVRVAVERDARSGQKQLRALEVFQQTWVDNSSLGPDDKILEVAPVTSGAQVAATTLQVREPGGNWKRLQAPIAGFQLQPGWRYRLHVTVSKSARRGAEGASPRYTLVRVLDKVSSAS